MSSPSIRSSDLRFRYDGVRLKKQQNKNSGEIFESDSMQWMPIVVNVYDYTDPTNQVLVAMGYDSSGNDINFLFAKFNSKHVRLSRRYLETALKVKKSIKKKTKTNTVGAPIHLILTGISIVEHKICPFT